MNQKEMDGGGGGSGGPAPFLLKTYDMVDDSSTDEIVSWSSSKNSFVVWNPPEFARLLLPTYFKHNNFSSFIRQLNTYGFRKIDPEKWEFANEEFVKDQKHLLKNIHRRKPIHSHSHPQSSSLDPERAAFEEEIERLSRDKATLEANILRFKQQRAAEPQLEELVKKVEGMAKRQDNLLAFLEKAVQNPSFVENLARKVESIDFSAYNKKRRLPQVDQTQPVVESSFVDNSSSSRSEFGNIFHQDFSNKLRLELSPTVSDVNLVSCSTQSSNEDAGSPRRNISEEEFRGAAQIRAESLYFSSETLELSDTGTSFTLQMDSCLPRKAQNSERSKLHSLQPSVNSNEDSDSHISCHLNLTLASSPLQLNITSSSARIPQLGQESGKSPQSMPNSHVKDSDVRVSSKNRNLVEDLDNSQEPPAAPVRANDMFWEQFLTERPGCSDNEEAISNHRANENNELNNGGPGNGIYRNTRNIDQLSL